MSAISVIFHCVRQRGGWRLLLVLALFAPAARAEVPVVLTSAEFRFDGNARAETVALPDTWAQRGLPARGAASYRLHFELEHKPAVPWALRFDRLAPHHQVRINGQLLGADLSTSGELPRSPPLMTWIPLPPALLHQGVNTLDVDVEFGAYAGISAPILGPADVLIRDFRRDHLYSNTLPLVLNVAGAALSLLMLLIWWRRPQEQILGGFGAFWAIASLRNITYYISDPPVTGRTADWLYFMSQLVGAVLLGRFASALSGYRLPGYSTAQLVAGGLTVGLSFWAAWTDQFNLARSIAYPLLIALLLPALWLLGRSALALQAYRQLVLAIGLTLMLGSAVHDLLYLRGELDVTNQVWLPYAVPLTLGTFAWMLVERLVAALHQQQQLNAELETRVEQRTLALQQANAAKSRFLASASHDLRQPVVAIGLMVGLLREQILAPNLREMIDRVDEAIASMETLLAGLLDLSRLESGTVQPRSERVTLQTLFDAIDAHEFDAARRKGLDLRFRPTRLAVKSDPVLLEQILRNLVSNALRYTDRGGVLVVARSRGDKVLVQVWDTGRGIPADQQAAVFEEFVQLGNRARDNRLGLGLGLAIVRRAATLLGHPVHLRSVPKRGSCFGIELPRTEAVQQTRERLSLSPAPLQGRHVLVVEDDQGAREALTARLQHWGASVRACEDLPALRQALLDPPRRPDLLITDQRLPAGSGLGAIAHLRRHYPDAAALIVTGNTAPAELTMLSASGVPVLHKPFRSEALLAAIADLLDLSAPSPDPGG